jgi:chromosome segregation ATPase
MHLKSLTLKGFKSFPDRTSLDFAPGVSVIVGPNGSGKSNITDAVLWALGEQSPLAVRGQTMQDVLFSGGHGQSSRSSAEVEVVIDNSDHGFQSDFSELSISRKLDRSGEGEYRLNGARCRLIDVIEVLSDTGLGKEMHSVVSQGRVEGIIHSKPADRRSLIEEAAGLGKHRKRRRRAELKLARTSDNLARALDIEREARSRLRPLKRQAEAADLHARLERQQLEARLDLLRDSARDAGRMLAGAEKAVAAARSDRDAIEAKLADVAKRRHQAEEDFAARSRAREELSRSLFASASAIDRIDVRLERVRAAADSAQRATARTQLALEGIQAAIKAIEGLEPDRLGTAAEEAAKAAAEAVEALEALSQALAAIEGPEAKAARAELKTLSTAVQAFDGAISNVQDAIAQEAGEIAERAAREAARRKQALAERAKALQARLGQSTALAGAAGTAAKALEDAMAAVSAHREALHADLKSDDDAGPGSQMRDLAREEAEAQSLLRVAGEAVTRVEVAAQQARDAAGDVTDELAELAERLGVEGGPAKKALSADERSDLEARIARLTRRREQLGPVNPLARREYEVEVERVDDLGAQRADLEAALTELEGIIKDADRQIRENFEQTFEAAAGHFEEIIAHLFPGGRGRLRLVKPDSPRPVIAGEAVPEGQDAEASAEQEEADPVELEPGVEVEVTPAGKSMRRLSLLSGGEKSLVALGFLFAVFLARPCPFYILDEVEAALDDRNIDRFLSLVRRCSDRAQFIVVTHQKRTMDAADRIYGVSMGGDGVSKVVSRRLDGEPSGQAELTSAAEAAA